MTLLPHNNNKHNNCIVLQLYRFHSPFIVTCFEIKCQRQCLFDHFDLIILWIKHANIHIKTECAVKRETYCVGCLLSGIFIWLKADQCKYRFCNICTCECVWGKYMWMTNEIEIVDFEHLHNLQMIRIIHHAYEIINI